MGIAEGYVKLCLRIGRHLDGFVDAYVGPPEWQQSIAAAELVDPSELLDEAKALLDELDGADLEAERVRWLRGQLEAIECITERLSGKHMTWADEVERCLGVRPARTDTSVFDEIHRRLDATLPGSRPVRERYIGWSEKNAVPRDETVPALERLREVLGPRAHALATMPPDETVSYELVSGKSWAAYAWYEGRNRTRVQVNADRPISVALLVDLAAHEAYPGHHTERTAKDAHLHRDLGRVETSVVVLPAPEALISEGIAMNALEQALGSKPFHVVADILSNTGVRFDPDEAYEIHCADLDLYATATNAAFMLHEDGASRAEAEEYMRAWGLESEERAAHAVAFMTDPASRTYISAYQDGRKLCRAFADRESGNFTRLLTEQLTTSDLLV